MARKKKISYFVSYYEGFPIYEPAEGGYYYEGRQLVDSIKVGSLKKARRIMRAEAENLELPYIRRNMSYRQGEHIGDSEYIYIETVQGIHESGYHPYC